MPAKPRSQGSALIAVIAAVLLFSVLAATLVVMVGSSGQEVVLSNLADRAYYMAESGHRYALDRFNHPLASDTDPAGILDPPMQALENMEGEHTLGGTDGQFDLKVYSFFYLTTAPATSGDETLEVQVPGTFPKEEVADLNGQQVAIEGHAYTLGAGSGVHEDADDQVTLSIPTGLAEFHPSGTMVLPATQAQGDQILTNGGELSYTANGGDIFPLRNGMIQVNGINFLTYRINDRDSSKFVDVRSAGGSDITGLTVTDNARVVLMPYTRIHATGIAGSGDFQARREVVYSGGLPWSTDFQPINFEEKFNTDTAADKWTKEGTGTATAIQDVGGGNKALRIQDSTGESLISLKPSNTSEYFEGFRAASGNYLSYDAQVKVGFYGVTPTETDPMPANVAAGLSFRLNNILTDSGTTTYNGYGLSFVNGDGDPAMNGIVPTLPEHPLTGQPLIVLWQQTGDSTSRKWLAYKKIQWVYFNDFSSLNGYGLGTGDWTNVEPGSWGSSARGSGSLFFGIGEGHEGTIESPEIDLTPWAASSEIRLAFDNWDDIYDFHARQVQVSVKTGETWGSFNAINTNFPPPSSTWQKAGADLTAFAGKMIKLRFYYSNPIILSGSGWHVDNVAIKAEPAWPVQNSTLLVRLQEATVVKFTAGGPNPVNKGDWVQGSDTSGTVILPVLLTSGSWEDGSAEGTLLLNNLIGEGFSIGQTLKIFGSTTTSNLTVQAYNGTDDRKVNIIRTYYASEQSYVPPNNDQLPPSINPLDRNTLPYPRGSIQWPVDDGEEWTAAVDSFRLIQWDEVNSAVPSLTYLNSGHTMLRSNDADLQSQPITIANPELGLHAYGASTEVTKVYFDDFGFQLIVPPQDLNPAPLQQ